VNPEIDSEIVRHRDPRMHVDERLGYLDLIPGEIGGFDAMRETCLGLLEARRSEVTARRSKKDYLRPVLQADDFLRHPEIVTYCLDPKLLAAAADYLGEPPVLRSVQLYWTSENETEIGSQRWHYDHIPPRQLKLFVYLVPVSEDTGPFTFLPANVSEQFMVGMGKSWEEANRKTYADEEIVARCGMTAIRRLVGPAGAGGLVDTTRCLHYGGRTQRGERLVMIIQYTLPGSPGDAGLTRPSVSHADRLTGLQRSALRMA
jgi:hypothetical protein